MITTFLVVYLLAATLMWMVLSELAPERARTPILVALALCWPMLVASALMYIITEKSK